MTKLSKFCTSFVEWGVILILVFIPLIFTTALSDSFGLPKIVFFRTLITLMSVAWLIKIIEEKKKNFFKVRFALPIIIFLVVYLLSTIFSLDFKISFWGAYLRLDGFYTFIFYILFFFLVASHLRTEEKIKKTVNILIFASLLAVIYGIFQHFNIDFIDWPAKVSERIISTLGNPLHVGGYLIMIMPLTLAWFFLKEKNYQKIIFGAIFILQFIALIFTLARSAWLGFLVSFFVFFFFLGLKKKKRIIWIGLIVSLVIISIFIGLLPSNFLNLSEAHPYLARLTSSFNPQDASSLARIAVWETTIKSVWERPLLGYGPGTFIYVLNKHYPPSLAKYNLEDFDYAHNQILDLAVAHGLIGLAVFAFIILYFFYSCIKLFFKTQNSFIGWLAIASISGVLAWLIQNQFGFGYVTTYVYFYFFLGLISALYFLDKQQNNEQDIKMDKKTKHLHSKNLFISNSKFSVLYIFFLAVGLALIIWTNFLPLLANIYYKKALESSDIKKRQEYFQSSIKLIRPQYDAVYRAKFAEDHLRWVASLYKQGYEDLALNFLNQAIEELNQIIKNHPLYLNAYLFQGRAYNFWGKEIDSAKLNLADQSFQKAAEISPTRQSIYWWWGQTYLIKGEKEKALEKYQFAISLDPTVSASYYQLGKAYKQLGNQAEAAEAFQKAKELKR